MPSILSRTSWARARRKRAPFPPSWAAILEDRVPYYRVLPPEAQEELRGMLQVLMGEWAFEPGGGLEAVDEAMRIVIAAQACVLLLHRPLADLPALRTAIVYPKPYQAREQMQTEEGVEIEENEDRFGEAWAHGVLLFSWEDVVYDAQHMDDGQNIVFHEIAHALDDQNGAADGIPLLVDRGQAEAWNRAIGDAFDRHSRQTRRRNQTVLDSYAAEDRAEFFAGATEAFFEIPECFRAEFPDLYELMRGFYHLDPITWASSLGAGRPSHD